MALGVVTHRSARAGRHLAQHRSRPFLGAEVRSLAGQDYAPLVRLDAQGRRETGARARNAVGPTNPAAATKARSLGQTPSSRQARHARPASASVRQRLVKTVRIPLPSSARPKSRQSYGGATSVSTALPRRLVGSERNAGRAPGHVRAARLDSLAAGHRRLAEAGSSGRLRGGAQAAADDARRRCYLSLRLRPERSHRGRAEGRGLLYGASPKVTRARARARGALPRLQLACVAGEGGRAEPASLRVYALDARAGGFLEFLAVETLIGAPTWSAASRDPHLREPARAAGVARLSPWLRGRAARAPVGGRRSAARRHLIRACAPICCSRRRCCTTSAGLSARARATVHPTAEGACSGPSPRRG